MLLCRPLRHNQIGEAQWGLPFQHIPSGRRRTGGSAHSCACVHSYIQYLFRSALHACKGRGTFCTGCERKKSLTLPLPVSADLWACEGNLSFVPSYLFSPCHLSLYLSMKFRYSPDLASREAKKRD